MSSEDAVAPTEQFRNHSEQLLSNGDENGSVGSDSSPSKSMSGSPKSNASSTIENSNAKSTSIGERSPEFQKLIEYGLEEKVANRLEEIYKTGKLSHSDLDQRALDALKEFPPEGALGVLAQFLESNLAHVSNKSAFLCGVMKTYRVKSRGSNSTSSVTGVTTTNGGSALIAKGPDEDKIKEILNRTGYKLDVTTGQRKYGGPPPNWEGDPPASGCEVFCGKIPRDMYESELIPLFEKCGKIWDLRLMMDPMTGLNRGYAFVTFTTREAAHEAVCQLDSYEIAEGKSLKINVSEPKTRLFLGNIPKSKDKEEIEEELRKLTAGLREVIIYSSPDDKKKNRGFCFLEYESHKAASLAKRRLETGRIKVWSCDIIVDWADPQEEPDDDTMSQVKVLYVRNLTATVTEEKLQEVFEEHGKVDRVKKIKDYAFVHFQDRDKAVVAMNALNHTDLLGANLEISLAKPPSDKKKKEEMLRKREARMMRAINSNEVAFRLSRMTMAMPPFAAFPAAYPFAAGLGGGIYPQPRGAGGGNGGHGLHGRGGHHGPGGDHSNGGGPRGGGLNGGGGGWQWSGIPGGPHAHVNGGGHGWAGDASWPQRGPVPWMAAGAEVWGHPRSGGNNFNWDGIGGRAPNGNGNLGRGGGGGNRNKNYSSSRS